ncbi:MAG: thiamine pyrophosphate-binding protein [bacterium]|jgi:acetolactate synthase-1/2/3 large subunit|nr:thiamine pyrophosphate-binding protein [Betaproteobacteria bacterium]
MTPSNHPPRTGGQILADQLRIHGVDLAFGVPGESYLALLDAMHDHRDAMRFVICRQEGGAANMADAYGKLTGRPGICMVTRGPGATNASIGVHTAFQDSTPMILFIGQVARDYIDRESFQEIDYRRFYGPFMSKWTAQIDSAARVPEYVSRAFQVATSGRPGPVVLALPEDMLTETACVADALPWQRVQASPSAADLQSLHQRLAAAKRPFLLIGGSGWTAQAIEDIGAFAQANRLPVGCSFRCQDLMDNRSPNYAGDVGVGINPALADRIKAADLLLVVGPRLGEMATQGYTLLDVPRMKPALVHVHAGAEELGHVYQGDLMINAGMPEMAAALRALPPVPADACAGWSDWTASAHADYLKTLEPVSPPGDVNLSVVLRQLRQRLPDDAIVTNGAGNYAAWLHRFFDYRSYRTQLAPTSGAMGYGVPSAVAAALVHPDRVVVSWNGDGCFMMNGQEMATAAQFGAKVVFCVVNNGMFGTIRMHQEREYPARVSGTELKNPDFVQLGRAYGAHAELVTRTDEFAAALERCLAHDGPSLIEIRTDPEAITPRTTLAALRNAKR